MLLGNVRLSSGGDFSVILSAGYTSLCSQVTGCEWIIESCIQPIRLKFRFIREWKKSLFERITESIWFVKKKKKIHSGMKQEFTESFNQIVQKKEQF